MCYVEIIWYDTNQHPGDTIHGVIATPLLRKKKPYAVRRLSLWRNNDVIFSRFFCEDITDTGIVLIIDIQR